MESECHVCNVTSLKVTCAKVTIVKVTSVKVSSVKVTSVKVTSVKVTSVKVTSVGAKLARDSGMPVTGKPTDPLSSRASFAPTSVIPSGLLQAQKSGAQCADRKSTRLNSSH